MFLVEDRRHGTSYLVFTSEDPRKDGYKGEVIDGVSLDYDLQAVHSWPEGQPRPEACVGRDGNNPKHYKVFKFSNERQSAGYQPVAGTPLVLVSWREYVNLNPQTEDLEKLDEESWYERLDEYDEASRRRRQRAQEPDRPAGASRDEVANWVAKKHLLADSSIREVWYLPRGAPPDEIRLLELNDRLAGAESRADALDFGLDIDGARFRLFVADVTSEELEQIKRDPSRLPQGWTLEANRVWRRGA